MADFSALQAEFAEEDRALAEAGLSDYAAGLALDDDGRYAGPLAQGLLSAKADNRF